MMTETPAVDRSELLRFLSGANRHGYAAGQEAVRRKEADGSMTILYESGPWRLHDNYFGGEPYAGRAVAFLGDAPIWIAVFYGWIDGPDAEVEPVYSFPLGGLVGEGEVEPTGQAAGDCQEAARPLSAPRRRETSRHLVTPGPRRHRTCVPRAGTRGGAPAIAKPGRERYRYSPTMNSCGRRLGTLALYALLALAALALPFEASQPFHVHHGDTPGFYNGECALASLAAFQGAAPLPALAGSVRVHAAVRARALRPGPLPRRRPRPPHRFSRSSARLI